MVQELLELKDKVEKIISESFKNDEKFVNMIRVSQHSDINPLTCLCV